MVGQLYPNSKKEKIYTLKCEALQAEPELRTRYLFRFLIQKSIWPTRPSARMGEAALFWEGPWKLPSDLV